MRLTRERKGAALVSLAFLITGLFVVRGVTPYDTFPDSPTYLRLSFTGDAPRLWTVPLLYKLGASSEARMLLQTLLSAGCWAFLAIVVARSLQGLVVRMVSVIALLALFLTQQVAMWNTSILSESAAISLTVALLASWLVAWGNWSWPRLALVLSVTTAWVFTRHSHVLLVPLLAVPWLYALVRLRAVRTMAVVGLATTAVLGLWSGICVSRSGDYIARFNQTGLLVDRGLTEPSLHRKLNEAGLPVSQRQLEAAGSFVDNQALFVEDERLQVWLSEHWSRIYIRWLVLHPDEAIAEPISRQSVLMAAAQPYYGQAKRLLPARLDRAASNPPALRLLTVLGLLAVVSLLRRRSVLLVAALLGIIFAEVWMLQVYALSATELERLSAVPGTLLRLASVLALLCVLQAGVMAIQARVGSHAPTESG